MNTTVQCTYRKMKAKSVQKPDTALEKLVWVSAPTTRAQIAFPAYLESLHHWILPALQLASSCLLGK